MRQDPLNVLQSCLATLCDDENEIRRLQLSEYASACEQENTTICDWRQRLREVLGGHFFKAYKFAV